MPFETISLGVFSEVNNGGTINMTKCIARGSGGGASITESEVRFDSGHWNFQ